MVPPTTGGFPHHNWPNQDNTSQAGQGVHLPDDYIFHQVDTKITHHEWWSHAYFCGVRILARCKHIGMEPLQISVKPLVKTPSTLLNSTIWSWEWNSFILQTLFQLNRRNYRGQTKGQNPVTILKLFLQVPTLSIASEWSWCTSILCTSI